MILIHIKTSLKNIYMKKGIEKVVQQWASRFQNERCEIEAFHSILSNILKYS